MKLEDLTLTNVVQLARVSTRKDFVQRARVFLLKWQILQQTKQASLLSRFQYQSYVAYICSFAAISSSAS